MSRISADKAGTSDGITKIQIKTSESGNPKVKISGGPAGLVLPAPFSGTEFFDQDTRVTIQLLNDSSAACWTSSFAVEDTRTNDADSFKAIKK